MKPQFNFYVLAAVLVNFFMTTGCGGVNFISLASNSTSSNSKSTSDSGNGGTYDGKLRVLHHYGDNFTCAGKAQPESILIRKNATDWVIIRNSAKTCAYEDQVPVSPDDYNDGTKVAHFENKEYKQPKHNI